MRAKTNTINCNGKVTYTFNAYPNYSYSKENYVLCMLSTVQIFILQLWWSAQEKATWQKPHSARFDNFELDNPVEVHLSEPDGRQGKFQINRHLDKWKLAGLTVSVYGERGQAGALGAQEFAMAAIEYLWCHVGCFHSSFCHIYLTDYSKM